MKIPASELTGWIIEYIWPFIRIAAFIGVAPIFGARNVPARTKILITLSLTVMVAPLITIKSTLDPFSLPGILAVIHEVIVGVSLGFIVTLIFSALIIAGQSIAQLMGLGFASMMDPQNGVAVPVVGQFYTVIATLLFLALNGHLILIDSLLRSFETMPIGQYDYLPQKLWSLVSWSKWMFASAIVIALPAITALLLINVAFGVMTRAAPQLNIFAVGFPITIIMGFVLMLITIPYFVPKMQEIINHAFYFLRHEFIGIN